MQDYEYSMCGEDHCKRKNPRCTRMCIARKNLTVGYVEENVMLICCFVAQQMNACLVEGKPRNVNVDGRLVHLCSWCGDKGTMKLCPCHKEQYCGQPCQFSHWEFHKKDHVAAPLQEAE